MARLHIPLRLLLLLQPFASLTSAIPTSHSLFIRQADDTCPSSQSACPSSLPSGLCCPDSDRCIALAGNTTVLCCQRGQDCDKINPITCNIEQQNPQKNLRAPIKTTVFDVELEKCGDSTCCPYGFSCEDGKRCTKNEDQDKKPGEEDEDEGPTTTSGGAGEARPTSTDAEGPTSTGSEAGETASSLPSDEGSGGSSGPDTTTIIGGVVGGIAALLAIAIVLFVCARRRAGRKPNSSSSSSSSFASNAPDAGKPHPSSARPSHTRNFSSGSGPRGNIISEPIMQQNSYRTDFMLKAPATSSVASTPRQPHDAAPHLRNSVHPHISTVSRDYDDPFVSPSPSARTSIISSTDHHQGQHHSKNNNNNSSSRLAPIRAMRPPRTPRNQPSCESINVFADPGTVERPNRYSMGTTVSGLMIDLRGDDGNRAADSTKRLNVPGTTPRI